MTVGFTPEPLDGERPNPRKMTGPVSIGDIEPVEGGFYVAKHTRVYQVAGDVNESAMWLVRSSDVTPTGVLMLGMNAALDDEFWRFDAQGRFIVVDRDGSEMLTLHRTDDVVWLEITRTAATDETIRVKLAGDTNVRLRVLADGKLQWSSGAAGADTTLARGAASELDTNADLDFFVNSRGPILRDRTTGTRYRLFVNNGTLGIEAA